MTVPKNSYVWNSRLFAIEKHGLQKYGEHPYMYHINQVVASVSDSRYDDTHVCVAYLHDVLEDTDATEGDLTNLFGWSVANAVVALTKVSGETPAEYLDKVATNEIALTVKMHDTLCNLTESLKMGQMGRVRKYSAQLNKLASYK